MRRELLIATAVAETGAGVALLLSPPLVTGLLLGVPIDAAAGLAVGRLAGWGS